MTTDLTSHLSELKMPVLLVNGEKDSSVPMKSAVAASKAICNCQLYIMKGCRHWAQKERPDEFVQLLKTFLLTN
jgi:pimeloyl-ACP methyl ester carboxylesterase